AGGPRIAENGGSAALEDLDTGVAEDVEGAAQRFPPALVPSMLAASGAAAVLPPAADAVGARPGALLDRDDVVVGRRVLGQVTLNIGDGDVAVGRFHGERVG